VIVVAIAQEWMWTAAAIYRLTHIPGLLAWPEGWRPADA